MSVNKVILLGRLTKDPEIKYTPSSKAVANFSVATSETYNDKNGQKQEKTEFHKVVVWGKLAELCGQYLSKGRQAYIEGSLKTRSWDAKDGSKRYTTEIDAKDVKFIGKPEKSYSSAKEIANEVFPEASLNIQVDNKFTTDEIPF